MKKLKPKSWIEIAKSVRKLMPPPIKVDKSLKHYDRKKAKKIPEPEPDK